jgi:hypothetical protein
MTGDRGTLRGALIGAATGVVFGLAGFALAQIPATKAMGSVMFMLVPIAAGVGIVMVTPVKSALIAAGSLSLLLTLALLVALGKEGPLCAVMAFPVLWGAMCIGIVLGLLVRSISARFGKHDATMRSVVLLLMPVLIYTGHRAELVTFTHPRQEIVTTTIHLSVAPEEVWANIQSLDRVAGKKPFLMHVGLPIPMRCVLQGTGAGAKRTCYFDQGFIEETVLKWSPPNRMLLSIDRTNMPGRHWLEFEGAEYELHGEGSGTSLTRTTTINSNLYPSWYWRPLERWGVASEHEYLFSDLARRFSPTPSVSR